MPLGHELILRFGGNRFAQFLQQYLYPTLVPRKSWFPILKPAANRLADVSNLKQNLQSGPC